MGRTPLYYFGRFIFRVIFRLFCWMKVEGLENLPQSGGAILAANHTSHLDPPVVGSAVNRPVCFMAKKELFEVPVLGWLIRRTRAFPVDRKGADRRAIRRAQQLLQSGELLVMFPEGTRSPDGRLQSAELGLAMIATRAGVPVVPIGLVGADRALRRGSVIFRPARIWVRIGAPVYPEKEPGGEKMPAREKLAAFSDEIMQGIGNLLPEEMGGRYIAGGIEQ